MPNPDPSEIPRPLFSRRTDFIPPPAEPPAERSEEFRPQYVSLHSLRAHGHGPRNLAWGVVTLLLAIILVSVSLFLTGPKALLTLAVCLLTFTALFVLARMHIFRQRNGGFLALGIVCLFGAAMPLIERSFESLETYLRTREPSAPAATARPVAAVDAPLLTEAFALTSPDPKAGPQARVLKDTSVAIEGKSYLVKAGESFPFTGRNGRDVTIAVRDLLVGMPSDAVEILDEKVAPPAKRAATAEPAPKPAPAPVEAAPAAETPAQITERAQREVIRRYPALGVKGSLENQMFVTLFTELRESGGDEFFQNPEWPLELAELLAKREGWQHPGAPAPAAEPTFQP